MKLTLVLWSAVAVLLGLTCSAHAQPVKAAAAIKPVPEEVALAAAEKQVRELFASDFAKPKAADQLDLARKLIKLADETADNPAAQFVMYRAARVAAAKGGDLKLAFQAIAATARAFAVGAADLKAATLEAADTSAALSPRAVAEAALGAIEEAVAGDDYPCAARLAKVAVAASAKARVPALAEAAAARGKEVEAARRAFDATAADRATLLTAPADATACGRVGRFLCLTKGNWESGLPLLAKGRDAALGPAVEADLAAQGTAPARLGAGDAWWDLGEKLEGIERDEARTRARHWYGQAASESKGLHKIRIEKRIAEADQDLAQRAARRTPAAAGEPAGPAAPTGFAGRTGALKERLLASGGGSAESEQAVARGLAWIARQQLGDKKSKTGWWQYDAGVTHQADLVPATGMAVLAFLAAGETHKSGKQYQAVVARGIAFLKASMDASRTGGFRNPNGRAPMMYGQAIGCMALVECYGMTKDSQLKPYAQKAVNFIQASQGANGSWGYSPGTNGDTSILGWQIQALHAAKLAKGLAVDDKVLAKAMKFLDSVAGGSDKATYGYTAAPGTPATSLTAIGLLCRHWENGWKPDSPAMAQGVEAMLARLPLKTTLDTYYYYYATQLVHSLQGKGWKAWNEGDAPGAGVRDMLIGLQVLKNDPDLMGSWDADQGMIGRSCGRLGTTAMAVLTLEVYYRHLPLPNAVEGMEGPKPPAK